MKLKVLLAFIFLSMLSGVAGSYIFLSLSKNKRTHEAPTYQQIPLQTVNNKVFSGESFAHASAISRPSVVYIKTIGNTNNIDPLDYFFGGGERQVLSSGSGVIYTRDGFIITNNHVIDGASQIEVIHNKRSYEAQVVGKDPSTDLAILKIAAQDLPHIKIGRSKDVQVGEWVLAVGNPFNLTSTVTAGIVSAKGRNLNLLSSRFPIESFIQTDAAINPGNSGGALVNTQGELIGINTAILSRTGSYTGYGFAVPVDIVVKTVNDIIAFGAVQKALLGVDVTDIDDKVAKQYALSDLDGVVITNIKKGSAAEKIKLEEGDVIVSINNEIINSKSNYDEVLSYFRPGDKVNITLKRDGKQSIKKVTLTNTYGTSDIVKLKIYHAEKIGLDLEEIPTIELNELGIKHGVRIHKIFRGPFASYRIEEGFVITKINNQLIREPKDVENAVLNSQRNIIVEGVNKNGTRSYYQFYF